MDCCWCLWFGRVFCWGGEGAFGCECIVGGCLGVGWIHMCVYIKTWGDTDNNHTTLPHPLTHTHTTNPPSPTLSLTPILTH